MSLLSTPPSNLRHFLDSDGEKVRWWAQPYRESVADTTLRPILYLLGFIGFALLIWASYQLITEINAHETLQTGLPVAFRKSILSFLAALFFLGFMGILHRTFRKEVDNNTYYLITNQRVQIIEYDPDDPPASKRTIIGPGEIREWSTKKVLHDRDWHVMFYEAPADLGKVEDKSNKVTRPRRPVLWGGFMGLTESQVREVDAALEELKNQAQTITNTLLRFSFTRPPEWTAQTFFIPPERRDDALFNVLTCAAYEPHLILKNAKITSDWNTCVLTKRLGAKLDSERGSVPQIVAMVEGALRPEVPEGEPKLLFRPGQSNIDTDILDHYYHYQGLSKVLLICELRQGYCITQSIINEIANMKDRRKQPLFPTEIIRNLTYFRDWFTSDKDVFSRVLELSLPKSGSMSNYRKWLKKWILKKARVTLPVVPAGGGDTEGYQLQINSNAKPTEANAKMNRSFKIDNVDIKMFPGNEYRARQIYMYHVFSDNLCLHLRLTFFCSHADKSKLFEENAGMIDDIAASIQLH